MNDDEATADNESRPAVVAPVQPSARLADVDAAFKDWVRAIPLHERTPWNVWHAAVDWVRRNG